MNVSATADQFFLGVGSGTGGGGMSSGSLTGGGGMSSTPEHVPVLLPETLAALELKPGELVIDGTFGAGGYSRAFLAAGVRVFEHEFGHE